MLMRLVSQLNVNNEHAAGARLVLWVSAQSLCVHEAFLKLFRSQCIDFSFATTSAEPKSECCIYLRRGTHHEIDTL